MAREETQKGVEALFKKVFNWQGEMTKGTKDNIEEWDSLSHIKLIIAIEMKFDIEVTPEEIPEILRETGVCPSA